ncbi:LacI family DNA-binding transcriptional regulator [Spirillospora sp. CA-142024]|uniref:LacI family DNA-binding transcriptional regulator n=1 Tax=Spirillospora sp. CA-142024 TaxID=3240036 RepID=UPI003D8E8706
MTGRSARGGGAKRPTLEDVAARAGVSRALVSIVIRGVAGASEETRERVLKAAAELGYRPDTRARLLARNSPRLLGVTFNVQHAFHTDLIEGIYAAADDSDYEVVLSALTPRRDERRAVETLLGYRCDALIMLGPESPATRLDELARRVPLIAVGRRLREPSIDLVHTDEEAGMRQAVDHLVKLGHRDIAHIDGGRSPKATDRRRAYRAAMRRHGLGGSARIVPGGQTAESGATAARLLLDGGEPPTAVIAYDDDCAAGVLDSLLRAGVSVPRDVSVIGFDDSRLSRLSHVNLTTIGQDAGRMASLAVERAVARLSGDGGTDRDFVISPHLVVRGTTASCRT